MPSFYLWSTSTLWSFISFSILILFTHLLSHPKEPYGVDRLCLWMDSVEVDEASSHYFGSLRRACKVSSLAWISLHIPNGFFTYETPWSHPWWMSGEKCQIGMTIIPYPRKGQQLLSNYIRGATQSKTCAGYPGTCRTVCRTGRCYIIISIIMCAHDVLGHVLGHQEREYQKGFYGIGIVCHGFGPLTYIFMDQACSIVSVQCF